MKKNMTPSGPDNLSTMNYTMEEMVARGKREILEDLGNAVNSHGVTMPTTITDFSTLHDYVDANEYGGVCDEELNAVFTDFQKQMDFCTDVQEVLHQWLVAGRPQDMADRENYSTGQLVEVALRGTNDECVWVYGTITSVLPNGALTMNLPGDRWDDEDEVQVTVQEPALESRVRPLTVKVTV